MKKRVLAGLVMAVMMTASVMSVSATGSKTAPVTPAGDNAGSFKVVTDESKFDYLATMESEHKEKNKAAQAAIQELDSKKLPASVVADLGDKKAQLDNKTLITNVFELTTVGTPAKEGDVYVVTLEVPALANCTDVVVLHYSASRGTWEIVDSSVNGTTLTAKFKDLSPVAIYAKTAANNTTNDTSHKTVGTSSTWMLLAAVAVVSVGAGVVVTEKKRHS